MREVGNLDTNNGLIRLLSYPFPIGHLLPPLPPLCPLPSLPPSTPSPLFSPPINQGNTSQGGDVLREGYVPGENTSPGNVLRERNDSGVAASLKYSTPTDHPNPDPNRSSNSYPVPHPNSNHNPPINFTPVMEYGGFIAAGRGNDIKILSLCPQDVFLSIDLVRSAAEIIKVMYVCIYLCN